VPHVLRVTVEPAHLDVLDHVNNVVYLRWVQDAAAAHSSAVGLGAAAFLARGGAFVVRRHEVDYLRPALLGDEVAIETRVTRMGPASSERRTVIRRLPDGIELARAVTRWAWIELTTGRPARIPPDVTARFTVEPAPF